MRESPLNYENNKKKRGWKKKFSIFDTELVETLLEIEIMYNIRLLTFR